MAKIGIIPRKLRNCTIPVCSACMYAKSTKKAWRSRSESNKGEATEPKKAGDYISVDQLTSPTPGMIAQMTRKLTTKRYKHATVYVDQATRLGFVYLQKTQSTEETIESKQAFERYAKERGVMPKHYHTDNGIFRANEWVRACKVANQGLTYAGVNAHHQNGMAERRICELQELARTMMIHATHWSPTALTANLWPYALCMANDIINESPSIQLKENSSPQQAFSNTKVLINSKHWKPFGCPVYVLDKALQKGDPFHKWKHRAHVGIYLGRSPLHTRNVELVMDLQTGLVSPQFHIRFDSSFHTTKDIKVKSMWQNKAGFERPSKEEEEKEKKGSEKEQKDMLEQASRDSKRKLEDQKERDAKMARTSKRMRQFDRSLKKTQLQQQVDIIQSTKQLPQREYEQPLLEPPKEREENVTRFGRRIKPVEHLTYATVAEMSQENEEIPGEIMCYFALYPMDQEGLDPKMSDPLYPYKATSDPDTMYLHEVMKEPDKKEFIKDKRKEIKDQMDNGNFSIIHKSKLPKGATVLPTVWQMKRKRDIMTRAIKKWKARLNIDGSRMKLNIHYDQTYAPVASWNSIRLQLTMVAVNNWKTKQLDFVLAYPQAPVEREICMTIPKGFELSDGSNDDYVLKLHRNIYG